MDSTPNKGSVSYVIHSDSICLFAVLQCALYTGPHAFCHLKPFHETTYIHRSPQSWNASFDDDLHLLCSTDNEAFRNIGYWKPDRNHTNA